MVLNSCERDHQAATLAPGVHLSGLRIPSNPNWLRDGAEKSDSPLDRGKKPAIRNGLALRTDKTITVNNIDISGKGPCVYLQQKYRKAFRPIESLVGPQPALFIEVVIQYRAVAKGALLMRQPVRF